MGFNASSQNFVSRYGVSICEVEDETDIFARLISGQQRRQHLTEIRDVVPVYAEMDGSVLK